MFILSNERGLLFILALMKLQPMESPILLLETAFAMMKPIMLTATMTAETVVDLASTQNTVRNALVLVK